MREGVREMTQVPSSRKDELELSIHNGKLKIILNGLEIQKSVHRLVYQCADPTGPSLVEIHLTVPISR